MLDFLLSPGSSGWPVIVEWLGAAIGIGIVGAIGRIQWMRGKRDAAAPTTVPAEVAGAIIDRQSAAEIVSGIERLGTQIVDLASSVRANTRAQNANRGAIEVNSVVTRSSVEQLDETRTVIRELTREIVRSGERGG